MNGLTSERRAFVISPHQDDAVISVGNHLQQYGGVDIANIFTWSASHMLPGVPEDVAVVSPMRKAEDDAITAAYGFTFRNGHFPDSEERGIAWNNYWATVDPQLESQIAEYLRDMLGDVPDTDIYIPAAFGLHPDHHIAHRVGMGIAREIGSTACYLYADQPYYDRPKPVRLLLHDQLDHARRLALPFVAHKKRAMLEKYSSQLTEEAVDWLSQRGAEYVWNVKEVETPVRATRYTASPSIFSGAPWQKAATKLRAQDKKPEASVHAKAQNAAGHTIGMSLFSDQHVVNGRPIQFLRPAGAGYYDYFDPSGSVEYDGSTFSALVAKARTHGDVLWLSGIREDSTLLPILSERALTGDTLLFEGAPSYIADCNPDGFDAWTASKPADTRKKIRRNDRKLERLINERSGAINIDNVDAEILSTFFDLQAKRAAVSEGKLDAFAEDPLYRSLLETVVSLCDLRACTVWADGQIIGVTLFAPDEPGEVLHIINQGFDPAFAEYGVGFVLQQEIIRYAHATHARSVDYLKGDEPYKRWFTNRQLRAYKYVEPLVDLGKGDVENMKGYVTSYVE